MPISLDSRLNTEFENNPDCKAYLQMNMDFFKKVGYYPPWIGYYVKLNNELVGAAAFVGAPVNNKVEIAYGTFEAHQGKGIGKMICRKLVLLALQTDPGIIITAKTLPQKNASASILEKNNFSLIGDAWDEDEGNVWEWQYGL